MKNLLLSLVFTLNVFVIYAQEEQTSKFILQGGAGMMLDFSQMRTNKAWLENMGSLSDYDKFVNGPVSWFSAAIKVREKYFVEASFASGWTYSTVYDELNLFENAPMHFPQLNINLGIRRQIIKTNKHKLSVGSGLGFMARYFNQTDYYFDVQPDVIIIHNFDFRYIDASDFNVYLNMTYSINVYKSLNLGLKASATYGIYYGFNTLIVTPVLEVEF